MTVIPLLRAEFSRLTATTMSKVALVALMIVPLLYGGLYLWANRDPYAALDQVPAAIVVADTGSTIQGEAVNYGKQVAKDVIKDGSFDWHLVSAAKAASGVRSGEYDFVLTLPANFSASLTSSSGAHPVRASLKLTTNDTNSYLASTIASQAADTVRASIVGEVNRDAASRFLLGFSGIHDQLSTAVAGASTLADGASSAQAGASTLAGGTAQLAAGAQQVADGNAKIAAAGKQITSAANQLNGQLPAVTAQVVAQLQAAGVPQATIDQVLAQLAPLGSDVAQANAQLNQVSAQLNQLAAGSAQVASGAQSAASGASALTGGLGDLTSGAKQLHDGLASGLAQVPDADAATRAAQAAALGDPVAVSKSAVTQATDYGAGLAPFFISLAAWIGIYALFLIVKPLSKRALTAVRKPFRVALAGWGMPALLGVIQMVALYFVVSAALKFGISDALGTVGFMALTSVTFAAIILALNVWLGSVGQFLGLVMMVVQLVTAGGTFPWQTLPGPLAALHKALPMSYAVDGLRQLMYGGNGATAGHDALVLSCWLLGAFALAYLGAHRMTRRRTLRDLRPSLIG